MQPHYNLAAVVDNATLEYQIGGASNRAVLRRLNKQRDPETCSKGMDLWACD